jgi:hypothetical protein
MGLRLLIKNPEEHIKIGEISSNASFIMIGYKGSASSKG